MIYVELDTLLDSRLGTVKKYDDAVGKQLLLGGEYYNRYHDSMWTICDIPEMTYKDSYEFRDHDTLKESKGTLVYKMINEYLLPYHEKFFRHMVDEPATVTVNVYPYELTDSFAKAIETAVANLLVLPYVIVIREDPETLPPWKLSAKYDHIIMYDFDRYMKPFYRELERNPCGEAVFHFPAIGRGDNPEQGDVSLIVDSFTRLSEGLRGYMSVSFEPVWNFNFHLHTTDLQSDGTTVEKTPEEEREAVMNAESL